MIIYYVTILRQLPSRLARGSPRWAIHDKMGNVVPSYPEVFPSASSAPVLAPATCPLLLAWRHLFTLDSVRGEVPLCTAPLNRYECRVAANRARPESTLYYTGQGLRFFVLTLTRLLARCYCYVLAQQPCWFVCAPGFTLQVRTR